MNLLPVKCPGTRHLAFKSQVLISSGIAALDSILGGGIPMGSVIMIEEDIDGVYTRTLFKYIYAEGVASGHRMFVAALDENERQIIHKLPASTDVETRVETKENEPEMKIAFRYKVYSEADSAPTTPALANFGHHFDLSKRTPQSVIDQADFTVWPSENSENSQDSLFSAIKNWSEEPCNNARILGIHSVGISPWPDAHELPKFLYKIRSLAQTKAITVIISVPTLTIMDDVIIGRLQHLSDCVIRLESLADSKNPLYAEYRGLLKVNKFPAINSVATHVPETSDWGFKVLSNKLVIEKLHLSPDIREGESSSALTGCHTSRGVAIDF